MKNCCSDVVLEKAERLYNAKLASGKYDHYSAEMLVLLFEDCITETAYRMSIERG